MSEKTLEKLYEILEERKSADPDVSYVASLYKKGVKKIGKKLGEEAVELVIDGLRLEDKPGSKKRRQNVLEESADMMFHFLVLLAHLEIEPEEVFQILHNRLGVGGLDEKAARD